MTPEEIKKIAEEVAHLRAFDGGFFPHEKEIREDYEILLQWLTARYYLVEKGKAKKLCELAVNESSSIDYALIDGLTDWVESEFNEEYHNTIDGKGPDIRKEEEE